MKGLLPETRNYDGCHGIDAQFDLDKAGRMVLLDHEKYLKWRAESWVMAKLASMLVEPPSIRYFERADA